MGDIDAFQIVERPASARSNVEEEAEVVALLDRCFDGVHEGRTYFKQIPHIRLLAHDAQNQLIGHLGLDYRIVRVGESLTPIAGIVDLCVDIDWRGRGLGAALLEQAEARSGAQEFALAMANDHRLYQRMGYERITEADVTWLAIDEMRCHSVIQRKLGDIFMAKSLTRKSWPQGEIDMLGYLF